MNRTLLSLHTKQRSAAPEFRPRDFRRMVALAWPFRRYLLAGVLLTIVFAGLHTVSLAGAFESPDKLLEEEGLRGWVDRSVAGERLGLALSSPNKDGVVRVVGVHHKARRAAAGVEVGDALAGVDGVPVSALLHDVAHAPAGASFDVIVQHEGRRTRAALTPVEPGWKVRLARAAGAWIPADADTPAGKLRTLEYILGGVLMLVLVSNLLRYWGEVLIAQAVLRGLMRLRFELYAHTLRLPMSFFAEQSTSDLVARFVQDIQEIQRGLIAFFGKFLREPLRAVFLLSLALFLDWRLTVTVLVAVPLCVGIFWLVGRSVKKANHKLLLGYGRMIDALTTSLQSLRVVKAYTAEEFEQERLKRLDLKMFKQQLKLAKMQALISPSIESLAIVVGSCFTVWLASRVLAHQVDVADFLTLGVVLSMLFDPLRKITDVYVRVQRSSAGAARIFDVLDQPVEQRHEDASLSRVAPLERSIELVDVSFTYPGASTPAVCGVNLSIQKGETLAVVGPNGSGKTTLVSMLPRFFDPSEGRILFDGQDIRTVRLADLRRQISLVTQDAIIFAGTPVDNITYGLRNGQWLGSARAVKDAGSDLTDRAEEAARRAFADEFIRNIPGGYACNLGERGTTLSGGQRQRIAIARAICRNAPILIFDEATSQVDSESELNIQQAVRDFATDRTTIIIAHRLSTIQFADRIVVMDAGRIVDVGPHSALFDRCTLYRGLCETQFVTERR